MKAITLSISAAIFLSFNTHALVTLGRANLDKEINQLALIVKQINGRQMVHSIEKNKDEFLKGEIKQ